MKVDRKDVVEYFKNLHKYIFIRFILINAVKKIFNSKEIAVVLHLSRFRLK